MDAPVACYQIYMTTVKFCSSSALQHLSNCFHVSQQRSDSKRGLCCHKLLQTVGLLGSLLDDRKLLYLRLDLMLHDYCLFVFLLKDSICLLIPDGGVGGGEPSPLCVLNCWRIAFPNTCIRKKKKVRFLSQIRKLLQQATGQLKSIFNCSSTNTYWYQ